MVKPFQKKLIAGIIYIIIIDIALILVIFAENSDSLYVAKIFLMAFKGGIIIWLYLNYRESKKVKENREKQKGRT